MTGSTTRRLGWKKTRGKNAPKLSIIENQASTKIYEAASSRTAYDLLLAANEHVSKNYTEAAIDALLLKRTQLLQ